MRAFPGAYTDDIFNGLPDQLEASTAVWIAGNATNMSQAELEEFRIASTVRLSLLLSFISNFARSFSRFGLILGDIRRQSTYERLVHALIAAGKFSWVSAPATCSCLGFLGPVLTDSLVITAGIRYTVEQRPRPGDQLHDLRGLYDQALRSGHAGSADDDGRRREG